MKRVNRLNKIQKKEVISYKDITFFYRGKRLESCVLDGILRTGGLR